MRRGLVVWCCWTALFVTTVESGGGDLQGPLFVQEPPHRLEFSNSSGGKLDCTAHGSPPPEVEWILGDSTAVHQVPELRLVFPNGSLVFPPFSSDRYRHDVHAGLYRCRLKSSLGVVVSREVHVKAGVNTKTDGDSTIISFGRFLQTSSNPFSIENFANSRAWTKKSSCPYCFQEVTHFPRHLTRKHQEEGVVKEYLSMSPKDPKRKQLLHVIRRQGNFMATSRTNIIRPIRRPKSRHIFDDYGNGPENLKEKYIVCKDCLGYFSRGYLRRHRNQCALRKSSNTTNHREQHLTTAQIFSVCSGSHNDFYSTLRLTNEVFPIMRNDLVSKTAMGDRLICSYAESLLKRHKRIQIRNVISNKMRELARLLISLKNTTGLQCLFDVLKPNFFDNFVISTKIISGYDAENRTFKASSLALHMGTTLKQVCDVASKMIIKKSPLFPCPNPEVALKDIKRLKQLIENHWNSEISSLALKNLNEQRNEKTKLLPLTEDVVKFQKYLFEESMKASKLLQENRQIQKSHRRLSECVLATTLLLNRKRIGEIQYLKLATYNRSMPQSRQQEFFETLSDTERALTSSFKRVVTEGKGSKPVPILFAKDVQNYIELLINSRNLCVPVTNEYLFANPSTNNGWISGYHTLKKLAKESGVRDKNLFTSTRLRKQIATVLQVLNMTENEMEQFAKFMGHTKQTHETYYRLPTDVYQTAKVSKVLMAINSGKAALYKGKTLNQISLSDLEQDSDSEEINKNLVSEDENNFTSIEENSLAGEVKVFNDTVVKQKYDIQVHDEYVIAGNTAVLKCKIPNYVAEYVMVTSWIQDDTINIYPNTDIGGKYVVLANGDLYISNAGPGDGYKNYACRTVHKLTGEVQTSPYPGRVIVTEPKGESQPRISVDKYNARRVTVGEDVTLPCVAQGYPVPGYYWKRELQGQSVPVALGERLGILSAGLLRISKVRLEDRGVYVCFANNSAGEESVRVTLEITAPLSAHVQPQAQVVDVGKDASFQCIVNGYPVSQVSWLHNGRPIAQDNRVEVMVEPPRLTVKRLTKEDRGMFQCFVSNNWDQAQATAELDMGDAGPELSYWFSEQTLQPGPTVSLKCVATGNPPPQFTWTLDGFPIPDHPRFLVGQYVTIQDDVISHVNITNIKAEDGGEYTCTAHNSVGKISHSARVNVYGLPYIREMSKITGVAGSSLIIKCPVAGYPIETITWERDGQMLPVNRRQRVYANGTLVVEQTQRREDAGTYTCQAQNRQRNTARRDVEVQVIVPPKILPINPMTDLLHEGMRGAITCQIMDGDLPITFRWERDGKVIGNNAVMGTMIRRIDEFSSSLIIEQVTSNHSGNYTCIASNVAGAEKYVVPLTVNVPPRWTVEPSDTSVASGQEATIHCQAEGYPKPVITWKKAVAEQPGEYKDFLFEPNVQQYQNGSLNFMHISKENEGQYLCEAKNNIGAGVSKVVFLRVNAPAHFPQKSKQIQVVKGDQAHLQCSALGDTPMEITWKLGGQHISKDGDQRYSIREQSLAEGMVSELGIERTIRQDTGIFICSASNAYGSDEMNIQLIVQEVPEPPKNVRVMDQLSRSIGVSWTLSYAGNSPITGYIVQYKPAAEAWPNQPLKVTVPGSQTTTTLPNLHPAQAYHLRVLAENRLGVSEPSQTVQVNTLEEVPSGSPVDIRAEAKSSTELMVTWEPPARESWNGNLLGYHVGYQEFSGDDSNNIAQNYVFKSVEVRPHYGGEAVLQGLSKFTTYSIIVQAYNSRGSGPASDPVTARTLEDAPTLPPENVQCSVLNAQSLHISWEPPLLEGQNGIIQGYKVTYHSVGEWFDNEDQQTKIVNQLRTTISGLRKYTNYSMTVLAYTSVGDGARSAPVYCQTEEDVPSAPAQLKAVLSAPNKILVSWLPPKFSNGPLTGYTFYMSLVEDGLEEGTHKRPLNPSTEMYEVIRPQETSTLQFRVTASTRIGEGESTRVITVTPSKTVPARIASFGREVISAWKQDIYLHCKRVGIPLPPAVWKLNDLPLEVGGRRSVLPNATLIIRDIQNVDQANYSCSVENQYGKDEIIYNLKVLVPPEAPVLTVVESFTDSLRLKWSDQGNGGSPILGYVINYKRDHGDWEELQISARTDEHMLRNLWCGTRYLLYITAFNRIGTGLPCDIVPAHTKGTVPVQPKQSQMLTMNSTVVTIWLDSWGDGGCGILYFAIEYRTRYSSWAMSSNHVKPTERIYSIQDLLPATEYQLKITAHNNAGNTEAIYNFTTLTPSGVLPKLSPPVSHSGDQPFYANAKVLVPITLSLVVLVLLIAALFWRTKLRREEHNRSMAESPSVAQLQNKQNRDQQYLAVRVNRGQQPLAVEDTYKPESVDYIEDICPYATFQLSKPTYSESSYSGNVYSGPYHSSKEPEYSKVRRKGGGRLRDPHSESQESDNLGSTDSEVKKILTLHLPISEYDTLGSDSEGDGRATSQELMSFSHRMRGGAEGTSSSSETSPPSGSVNRKQFQQRSKSKPKSAQLSKRHVRSSSGYSSHNEETTFSISHAPSFNERIHPPTRFSDLNPRNLSESEYEKGPHKISRGMSKLSRETFQINV